MTSDDMAVRGRCIWILIALAIVMAPGTRVMAQHAETVGRQFVERYCSACHGMDGKGHGPVASALRTPPADLTQISKRRGGKKFPVAEIAAYIDGRTEVRAHGSRDMPVWGKALRTLPGGESAMRLRIESLTRHVESLQQK